MKFFLLFILYIFAEVCFFFVCPPFTQMIANLCRNVATIQHKGTQIPNNGGMIPLNVPDGLLKSQAPDGGMQANLNFFYKSPLCYLLCCVVCDLAVTP